MNYKNMLKHAGMLCEYDDLTRDTSNDYAILDELKKLKDTYLGDDFYWWDGTSWGGKTSKDEPLSYWDGRDGTSHYFIKNRYGTQFSIIVDTKQNIIIKIFLGDKRYATYNSIDEFEEFLKKRNNARKQKKSISDYDEDQAEWISGAHENESIKIKNKNMTINEAKQLLENHGYIVKESFGDWAARAFKGETLLGQEMDRMDDKLANHFAGLLSLQMSRAASKLKNDKYFVNDLIQKCNKLARQFRSAAKSDDDMVSGTFQLQTLLATSFHRIMEELEQYDSRININSKVFDANVPSAECKDLAKEYGKVNEARQLLNRTGYKLIKENAGNNIDLTVYIYDDGYRPPKDEIEDNDPAKDWIDFLDWEVRSGHCYETKYNINDNNINETFKRIRNSMKYHYGYSYLNGSVRGTINGKEIYESISACDVIHDLKNIFKQNGIEVEFDEDA